MRRLAPSAEGGLSYYEYRARNWSHAHVMAHRGQGWVFRGHADASWRLQTTIERVSDRYRRAPVERSIRERWLLQEFRRRAHHYVNNPPSHDQRLEWLAMIQHYGGATRLLDFTHSFYVAAFFALEGAEEDAAIWCINAAKLNRTAARSLSKEKSDWTCGEMNDLLIEVCNDCLEDDLRGKLVVAVEPRRMNERLSVQHGLFLFPNDLSVSFEESLTATFGAAPKCLSTPKEIPGDGMVSRELDRSDIVKVVLPKSIHYQALSDLRSMNINAATLFPGLDGFARSLSWHLATPEHDPTIEGVIAGQERAARPARAVRKRS